MCVCVVSGSSLNAQVCAQVRLLIHLLWNDGVMVFQNDAFDVMSPKLPLLHRLCLETNRMEVKTQVNEDAGE